MKIEPLILRQILRGITAAPCATCLYTGNLSEEKLRTRGIGRDDFELPNEAIIHQVSLTPLLPECLAPAFGLEPVGTRQAAPDRAPWAEAEHWAPAGAIRQVHRAPHHGRYASSYCMPPAHLSACARAAVPTQAQGKAQAD